MSAFDPKWTCLARACFVGRNYHAVEMIESIEAKDKCDAHPVFELLGWKIGDGFYIKAALPNSIPVNIEGFKSENEAFRWIRNDSAAWLHARRHVLEKKEATK